MWAEIGAAFTAGLASFLSPCVLPLVPAYVSYISGVSVEDLARGIDAAVLKRTGLRSVLFVLGFSAVFVAGGAVASSIGRLFASHQMLLTRIAGTVIVLLGLHMTGLLKIKALYTEKRFNVSITNMGPLGAFVIGVLFGFGWSPCVGGPLVAILALASTSETLAKGVGLLAVYSLGLGVPFIITGFATGTALKMIGMFKSHYRKIEIAGGVLLVVVGALIFTGSLQSVSYRISELVINFFKR